MASYRWHKLGTVFLVYVFTTITIMRHKLKIKNKTFLYLFVWAMEGVGEDAYVLFRQVCVKYW
jgi:hypothetical protein